MIFSPEQIQSRLRIKPFLPLRIIASEGLRYDIRHPDLVLVGERELTFGLPKVDDRPFYDRMIRIPLFHIIGLEDLPEPATAASSAA
jgi:hypothetical protein